MDEGASAEMEAEVAPMAAVRTEAVTTLTNAAAYFYVWDQVGSIRVVMDGAGNLVVIHDYEPYGVEILPNNPTSMPTDALAGTHLYTGQERDADTGLDNFHFRSYASTMGRFLSPDNLPGTPLNPQSFNLYAYVHGNPVNFNDPTGHWAAGLPPGSTDYYGDPFGGLNFAPTGGIFEPITTVDALIESASGNQSTQSTAQPAAQDKQDSEPTAGQQATKLGGTIYNETGGLRPSLNKKGKTDSTSTSDLHNARKAIGQVVLNIKASGKTPDVASSAVSSSGKRTEQYADSLSAAQEAIKAGGDKTGPKHFYIRSGALTIQNGVVTAGDQPSWGKGVVPTASYGPFRNPVKAGDVAAGNSVYVDIYNVP
jgi:RHS repeat-associated protein